MVILDTTTRWNSIYNSIKRGLKLKNRIRLFCSDYSDHLHEDSLSEDDWTHLTKIAEGLRPFHEATLVLEGNAGQGHHGAV
jgi:hypothetical protein